MKSSSLFPPKSFLNIRGTLKPIDEPKVMGILNITTDSFYDGGQFVNEKQQLLQVESMLQNGADFIDIGAQSTRPGAKALSADEELALLKPCISSLRKQLPEAIVSVDTFYSKVALEAHNLGADMINDISGGQIDDAMFEIMAQIQIPYVLMHTQGTPEVMQKNPHYDNVLKEVIYFMSEQIQKLNILGVNDIIIDPGFGFGKTLEHNYQLLNQLNHFSFLESPILVGISRKSMIYKPLNISPVEALNGTTALHIIALNQGANILRVHDVKEAKQCIELYKLVNSNK